ncbi:MAG: phytoene desaturase family protein [Arenicella sp.]|jgi:phytoene desaturase|nr:phytoene desaturase family protein [Arenicella sp.]
MKNALVIGAGVGGMAAALRLRAKGYQVTVLDRCERPGGRAQVFERDGFKFDAGPTVITAPFLFDELFQLFGRERADYVEFLPLNPWYQFYYPDGTRFNYGGTIDDTLREINKISPEDCQGYLELVDQSQKIFDVGFTQLAHQPFHSFWTMIKQVPALIRLKCYRTVWQLVSSYIKHPKLRQAFSVQPLLVGGSPFDTTSIYGLIHFLERKWHVFFAKGGTGALIDALAQLMKEQNISMRLSTTVDKIIVENGTARGVTLASGEQIHADVVVANTDPVHLYRNMLDRPDQKLSAAIKQRHSKLSMGLFVLFFGTDKTYPDVEHHTIWLGRRYEQLLRDIFDGDELPQDFSLYLHRPTATDPDFAPAGKDSFYVLAPVPNLKANIDWATEGDELQRRIVAALSKSILPGLEDHIVSDFYMTPEDFAKNYLSIGGAGFSVAPLFSQSAWFRFHNKAEGPKNLYLVGAGTHPGAGLPGVLSSAKVLDQIVPAVQEQDHAAVQRNASLATR